MVVFMYAMIEKTPPSLLLHQTRDGDHYYLTRNARQTCSLGLIGETPEPFRLRVDRSTRSQRCKKMTHKAKVPSQNFIVQV